MKALTKLWIGLIALAVLTPLGLFLPAAFGSGAAWGEWSAEELAKMVGYAPKALAELQGLWHALLPDYAFPAQGNAGLAGLSVSYIFSAFLGVALVAGITLLVGRMLAHRA